MEQLLHVVTEQLLKSKARILDTIHEISGSLFEQFDALFKTELILLSRSRQLFALFENLDCTLWRL